MTSRPRGWSFAGGLLLLTLLLPGPARALSSGLHLVPTLRAPLARSADPAAPAEPAPLPPPPVQILDEPPELDPTAPVEAVPRDQLEPLPVFAPEPRPAPAVTEGEVPADGEHRRAWDSKVLGFQLLIQLGATAASGVVGLGIGGLYLAGSGDGWGFLAAAVIGTLVAGLILHPLAAHLVGHWMGGRGKIWGTVLGFIAGAGAALLVGMLAGSIWGIGSTLLSVLAITFFYAGSMVGYHLSQRLAHPDESVVEQSANSPGLVLARLRF